MSYTEINHKKGMPYGGMPYDALLQKLEETDPALVSGVTGHDEFYDLEEAHHNYVRAEIIDRTPDNTYLESDHHRRDPSLSRGMLNLRYNGTRGSDYELPQHPELFLGFTGNDPRGRTNDPRLDKARAHGEARARNYEVRMGQNVGHGGADGFQIAERPWTGPSREYAKKEIHRRLRDMGYTNWFTTEKEGRPWGRNQVADEFHALRARGALLGEGAESLYDPEQEQARFLQGDYGPASGLAGEKPRRVDRSGGAETALWRRVTGDADLAVARYGRAPAGGRGTRGDAGHGGALTAHGRNDQDLGASSVGAADRRRALAEGMSAGAAHRRAAARSGEHDTAYGAPATGAGVEVRGVGRGAVPGLAADLAALVRADQAPGGRAPGAVRDDEGGALGAAAGLAPAGDAPQAARAVRSGQTAAPNARLADAIAVAKGLREGTADGLRRAQQQVRAGGRFGAASAELGAEALGRTPLPGTDAGRAASAAEAPLARAAAAAGLEVHSYRGAQVTEPGSRAGASVPGGGLRASLPGRREGLNKALPEFLSHTQTSGGVRTGSSFGGSVDTSASGALPGSKNLRTTHLGVGAAGDELGAFANMDDGVGLDSFGGSELASNRGGDPELLAALRDPRLVQSAAS